MHQKFKEQVSVFTEQKYISFSPNRASMFWLHCSFKVELCQLLFLSPVLRHTWSVHVLSKILTILYHIIVQHILVLSPKINEVH